MLADRLPKWATPQQYGRSRKLMLVILASALVCSWLYFFHESIPRFAAPYISTSPIGNSTLGFQKIYALGLPGREDRIKPLIDAANATNLTLTILNAVKDHEIDEIDYPTKWEADSHRPGELGCLASHVRTWNLMIADNISSALVLESDADWDLRIRSSMHPLAIGVRTLVDWPFTTPSQTLDPRIHPYGDSWDILWIGHCGSNRDGNIRAFAWNDTSAPPKNREFWFDSGLMDEQYVPGTRSVFQFGRTTCSTGYAVSNAGAVKLAKYFKDADDNLDIQLSTLCSKKADLTCLGVWPQIITAANTKSNIEHVGDNDEAQAAKPKSDKVVGGPALQYSARVNAQRIIESGNGFVEQKDWQAEWDTTWAINPYKGHEWQMLKMNESTGEPIYFDPKKDVGVVLGELELAKLKEGKKDDKKKDDKKKDEEKKTSRVRRALLSDPY